MCNNRTHTHARTHTSHTHSHTSHSHRSEMLADQYRKKSRLYRTNVLLVPLGDDFRWDTQREIDAQFTNYYKLMDYMNAHADMNINVQFGTLSDYFEALRGSVAPNVKNGIIPDGFPMLTGDFFTYADRWVGHVGVA